MRVRTASLAALALALGAALAPPRVPAAAADDVAKEVRLLTLEGKFEEARTLLETAPDEVKQNLKLHEQLADMALKWAARQDGPAKNKGLVAAREHLTVLTTADPKNAAAAGQAVALSVQAFDLEFEAKQPDRAKPFIDWAITNGEAALSAGADSADLRRSVADAHERRTLISHKVNDFDRIVADHGRSAELYATCANTADKPAAALGAAARAYLTLAAFISENRPIPEETRDDDAFRKAVEIATQACETAGATRAEFTTHLIALRNAYRAGLTITGPGSKPYMEPLAGRDAIEGLDLALPKAEGWKRLDASEWDRFYERKLEDDDTAIQIMVKVRLHSEAFAGMTWDRVEEVVKAKYDSETKDFKDVASSIAPERTDTGKKGPEIWHFEVAGQHANGRTVRAGNWFLMHAKKDKVTFQIRMVDYRKSPDLREPDLVEFVQRALGLSQPEADDDPKGKGGKKKGKK